MRASSVKPWVSISVALTTVFAAALLRLLLYRLVATGYPFLTFFPAVIFSAIYGGLICGVLATGLSAAASAFWLDPTNHIVVAHDAELVAIGLFIVVGLVIVWICDAAVRARREQDTVTIEQARLAALVASSDDAIVSKDLTGKIQSWNAGAERLFGYSADEIIGNSILKIIPPERHSEEAEIISRLKRGEKIDHFETVRIGKDGLPREVSVTISPIRDSRGKIVGASKIARDITRRRIADAQLRAAKDIADRSLAQLQAVVENMSDGLIVSDAAGSLLEWNATASRLHGFISPEEVHSGLGDFASRFEMRIPDGPPLPPDDFPMNRVLRGESFVDLELYVRRLDTGADWIIGYSGKPILDAQGNVLLGILTLHDVKERRRAEAALRDSEASLRQLADTMPQIVWAAQPDGVVDYYNRRWFEYAGGPQIPGREIRWELYVHVEDLPVVQARWAAAIASGGVYNVEFRIRGAAGSFRWFLTRALPVRDDSGKIVRWFGTCTDVHEQKELQQLNEHLLASERAARAETQRAGRVKDEFLATLSHELRTPLNAILGWSHILQSAPAEADTLSEGLATIERNARAQTQIIEDLLDMSRIISGKVRLDVQLIEIAPVVREAIETVRPAADAKNLRINAVLDPLCGPVSGDPNRMQQVFWNLLSNAIKFTPKGGRIQVVLRRINSHVEIQVIDSGDGIAADFLPHVFDRFRQADASTTRKHGGLGLGLAIVKQLIEMHGGTIHASSEGVGKGATFTINLPVSAVRSTETSDDVPAVSQNNSSPRARSGAELEGLHVMVVDDEADARMLVKRLLEDRSARVTTADCAAQALEKISADVPDVLISDVGMPGDDGYSLIRSVRALDLRQGGAIPAVALTAYARSEDRTKAVIAGFQMHLAKPVEPAELIAVVASLGSRGASRTTSDVEAE